MICTVYEVYNEVLDLLKNLTSYIKAYFIMGQE